MATAHPHGDVTPLTVKIWHISDSVTCLQKKQRRPCK